MSTINLRDVAAIEGEAESAEEYYLAIQRAINSGSAWSFQGSYGRSMMDAIEGGCCLLGLTPAHDYYGNRIPARSEVKPHTKGSREFVVDRMGEEWAALMETA
jgi:hypothetical protein